MRGADSIKRRLAPSLWPGIACGLALGIAGCLVPAGGMGGAGKVPGMAATLAPDSGTGSGARAQGGAGAGTGAAAAALDAVTTARAEVAAGSAGGTATGAATGRPAGQAAATPGAPRTIAGSWKAYQLDYSTSPPSAATDLIALAEDGTFLLRRGTAYRGGDQPRLETVGGDSGTYTLLGDALTLRFADGSVKTGAVDGENLAIGGRTYYPCSGFGC